MLCNARTALTNASLYAEDTVFVHSFGIEALSSEATLRQPLDELPAERSQLALRTLNQPLLRGRRFGTVRALYNDHGSSEQFHSELKSELDIEQLPSGKLCVNGIVLLCGRLAFNLLRTLGQEVSFEQIWLP